MVILTHWVLTASLSSFPWVQVVFSPQNVDVLNRFSALSIPDLTNIRNHFLPPIFPKLCAGVLHFAGSLPPDNFELRVQVKAHERKRWWDRLGCCSRFETFAQDSFFAKRCCEKVSAISALLYISGWTWWVMLWFRCGERAGWYSIWGECIVWYWPQSLAVEITVVEGLDENVIAAGDLKHNWPFLVLVSLSSGQVHWNRRGGRGPVCCVLVFGFEIAASCGQNGKAVTGNLWLDLHDVHSFHVKCLVDNRESRWCGGYLREDLSSLSTEFIHTILSKEICLGNWQFCFTKISEILVIRPKLAAMFGEKRSVSKLSIFCWNNSTTALICGVFLRSQSTSVISTGTSASFSHAQATTKAILKICLQYEWMTQVKSWNVFLAIVLGGTTPNAGKETNRACTKSKCGPVMWPETLLVVGKLSDKEKTTEQLRGERWITLMSMTKSCGGHVEKSFFKIILGFPVQPTDSRAFCEHFAGCSQQCKEER